MDKSTLAVAEILGKISASYQNFQVNEYSLQVWKEGFTGYSIDQVKSALSYHIRSSVFPPTIADLLKIVDEENAQNRRVLRIENDQKKLIQFPPEIAEDNRRKCQELLRSCVINLKNKGVK